MANCRKPIPLKTMSGLLLPMKFSPECLNEALNYNPKVDDVIIATYPKCGTTWMQMVAIQIYRKGRALDKATDFGSLSPFFEMAGQSGVDKMQRPGPIKVHLPYDRMPYSPEAKYIIVIRNPFDTCVSLYYHTSCHPGYDFWDGSFDEFFECFMSGEVEYGDYFDHLLTWYPHRNDKNIYWTSYETMKMDLKSVVLDVAKFIGDDHYESVKNDRVMENILRQCDFSHMKKMFAEIEASRPSKFEETPRNVPKREHIRKGMVGGWKEYFSDEQFSRMKEKFETKTSATEISSWWPDLFIK